MDGGIERRHPIARPAAQRRGFPATRVLPLFGFLMCGLSLWRNVRFSSLLVWENNEEMATRGNAVVPLPRPTTLHQPSAGGGRADTSTGVDDSNDHQKKRNKKNLVILGAAGRNETTMTILDNIYNHFAGPEWDVHINCYKWEAAYMLKQNLSKEVHHNFTLSSSHGVMTMGNGSGTKQVNVQLQEGFQYGDFFQPHYLPVNFSSHHHRYRYVALVLDDVSLGREYSVSDILQFMGRNSLDVASSVIHGVGIKWGPKSYNEVHPKRREQLRRDQDRHHRRQRQQQPQNSTGRLVTSWEIFATYFTQSAFECFLRIVSKKNHHFHGMAACYYSYCSKPEQNHGRIGILDTEQNAYHLENSFSVNSSTTSTVKKAATNMNIKWKQKAKYYQWIRKRRNVEHCVEKSETLAWLV